MTSLKHTFDKNAEAYRLFRPSYPSTIADDIIALSGLRNGAHILEIGCGAGQATMLFAQLAPTQTCIDLGPALIQQCRDRFAAAANYTFVCSSFEDFSSSEASYDLIYAATSFHWLTPGLRFSKARTLLSPAGHLAVFTDKHIKNRSGFFQEVQICYETHAPELALNTLRRASAPVEDGENPLFLISTRQYDRDIQYTSSEYVGLLRTFSDHIALGEDRLNTLCDSISQLISNSYRGHITKTLTTTLNLYRKAQQGAADNP